MTAEQIFETLDITGSSDEFKASTLAQVMTIADLRFSRVVDEVMSDEEQERFNKECDNKSPQEIASWLSENYQGIDEMYTGIVEAVVLEMKDKLLVNS